MLSQNAKQWIIALRSGKYAQGTNQLRKGDQYCCLGVACDLYDNTQWRQPTRYDKPNIEYYYWNNSEYFLTREVAVYLDMHPTTTDASFEITPEWLAGLSPEAQEAVNLEIRNREDDKWLTLASLNDSGASFAIIAEIIESNPKGLFLNKSK